GRAGVLGAGGACSPVETSRAVPLQAGDPAGGSRGRRPGPGGDARGGDRRGVEPPRRRTGPARRGGPGGGGEGAARRGCTGAASAGRDQRLSQEVAVQLEGAETVRPAPKQRVLQDSYGCPHVPPIVRTRRSPAPTSSTSAP